MTKPSWQDYGTYDESEHARLWDGVVGAWCPSLGPTGSRLHDHSRFGNWGTLTGMDNATDWVVSGGQYALDFDGSNDYVTAGSLPDFPADFTVQAWGYVYSGDTGVDALIFRSTLVFTGAARSGISLVLRDAFTSGVTEKIGAEITDGNTRYHIESSGSYARDTWHHIVCRRRAGVFSLIINGKPETTTQSFSGNVTNADNTFIGATSDYQGGIGVLRRRVDDVVVWQRGLTDNEIQDLYLLGRGGMYQRRRRSRRRAIEQAAGFRAYWVRQQSRVIGGGV